MLPPLVLVGMQSYLLVEEIKKKTIVLAFPLWRTASCYNFKYPELEGFA